MIDSVHDRRATIAAILLSGLTRGYISMVNITAAEKHDFDIYNVSLDLEKKLDDFNAVVYSKLKKLGLADQIQEEIDILHNKLYKILK